MDTPDPLVVVLSGHPDDAELAALTVAIMALAAQPAAPVLPLPA
ncbi:MAG: acyl-CoA carboxylase subunit epsilon, partial [Pseudonocardia sp.]|nr:acyl-CoA carboxylase subunit epsilon [Pseudonocardia sp.]